MAVNQPIVSERKVIMELLELYKERPCLWNSSDPLFGSRCARKEALAPMLKKYQELVVDANMDTLKKKIEIFRTSYKREYKKVSNIKNHVPTLWYYNHMTFLNKGTSAVDISQSNDEEASGTDEASGSELRKILSRKNSDGKTEKSDDQLKPKRFKKSNVFPEFYPEEPQTEDHNTETNAFGKALGLQLNGLTQMQKYIAEKLISDIMYYSRLEKLTTETSLIKLNKNDDYSEFSSAN